MFFVFGSNGAGRHDKGDAAFASRYFGAIEGQGEGAQGSAYALPIQNAHLDLMPVSAMQESVNRLYAYARTQPDRQFQITRVGCDPAGYSDDPIRPLFDTPDRPSNCLLPGVWLQQSNPTLMRVIVAGGRDFRDDTRLANDLQRLKQKHRDKRVSIVSGLARGADTLGRNWALHNGVPVHDFPADWGRHGKAAGFVRNRHMAWFATHLVAYWNGRSPGTKHMIQWAQKQGLPCWIRRY